MDDRCDERNLSYIIEQHQDQLIELGILELNISQMENLDIDFFCNQAIDTIKEVVEEKNAGSELGRILKKDAITYLEGSKNRAVSFIQLLIHRLQRSADQTVDSETLDNLLSALDRASDALDSIKHADKYVTDSEALCTKMLNHLLPVFVDMHSTFQAGRGNITLDCIQIVARKTDRIISKLCKSVYRRSSATTVFTTTMLARLEQVYEQLKKAHIELIKRSILVESQPPQVLKKETGNSKGKQFQVVLRFLLNNQLQLAEQSAVLRAYYITERQLIDPNTELGPALGQPAHRETSSCGAIFKFKSLRVKASARAQNAQCVDRVTDEKCAILFRGTFQVRCPWSKSEQKVLVQTWSLPVVLTVHTNQEQDARATVWWDREFPVPGRTAFDVRENIPWPEFKAALSRFFKDQTKCELNDRQLFYVGQKLLFHGEASWEMLQNGPYPNVSFLQLVHQSIPDRKFSCWGWLWQVIKLIQDHLMDLWEERLIDGFVFKDDLATYFTGKPPGTFILRFSETQQGYIGISYLNDCYQVLSWNPYSAKDLQKCNLTKELLKFEQLIYLIDGRRKEEVLQKYVVPEEDESPLIPGYVRRGLKGRLLQSYQESLNIIPAASEASEVNPLSPEIVDLNAMDFEMDYDGPFLTGEYAAAAM